MNTPRRISLAVFLTAALSFGIATAANATDFRLTPRYDTTFGVYVDGLHVVCSTEAVIDNTVSPHKLSVFVSCHSPDTGYVGKPVTTFSYKSVNPDHTTHQSNNFTTPSNVTQGSRTINTTGNITDITLSTKTSSGAQAGIFFLQFRHSGRNVYAVSATPQAFQTLTLLTYRTQVTADQAKSDVSDAKAKNTLSRSCETSTSSAYAEQRTITGSGLTIPCLAASHKLFGATSQVSRDGLFSNTISTYVQLH